MARHGLVAGRDYLALGYVSDAELQCIYRLATVVAVPSLYEGFGLPGLEAMRAGCPIVYASIPPLEEQNQLLGGIIPMFDPEDPAALAAQLEWILTHPGGGARDRCARGAAGPRGLRLAQDRAGLPRGLRPDPGRAGLLRIPPRGERSAAATEPRQVVAGRARRRSASTILRTVSSIPEAARQPSTRAAFSGFA